jgi:hypothetical protein
MFANYDTSNIIAKRSVNLSHLETNTVETKSFDNQNTVEIEQVKRDDTKESNAIDDLN